MDERSKDRFTYCSIFHVEIFCFSYVHLHGKLYGTFSKALQGIITTEFHSPLLNCCKTGTLGMALRKPKIF